MTLLWVSEWVSEVGRDGTEDKQKLQLILQQAHALCDEWEREGVIGNKTQQVILCPQEQIFFVGKWIHILLLLLLLPRLFVTSKRSSFKYEWMTEMDEVDE